MKTTIVKALTIVSALTALGSAVAADQGVYTFQGISPSVLKVQGDGTKYTKLQSTNGNVKFKFGIAYDAGLSGKVKSYRVGVSSTGIHWSGFAWQVFDEYKSYANPGPKSISLNSAVEIPKGAMEEAAVKACNLTAQAMKNNGASDFEIYGKTRQVVTNIKMNFDVDVSGTVKKNSVIESDGFVGHNLTVQCLRKRGVVKQGVSASTGGIQSSSQLGIRTASLAIEPVTNRGGGCKARLYLDIQTHEPNINVNFRFHHNSGAKSSVFNKKSAGNGKFQFVKEFDVTTNQQGYAIGNFQAKNASGSKWQTNKASYNFKCASAPIGGIDSGQPKTGTIKLN